VIFFYPGEKLSRYTLSSNYKFEDYSLIQDLYISRNNRAVFANYKGDGKGGENAKNDKPRTYYFPNRWGKKFSSRKYLSDGSKATYFAESENISREYFLQYEPGIGKVVYFTTLNTLIKVNVPNIGDKEIPKISVKDSQEKNFKSEKLKITPADFNGLGYFK
jgi:hypothetical protein